MSTVRAGVDSLKKACGLLLALSLACSTLGGGTWHEVKPGENLYRISRYYGVPVKKIIRKNGIRDATALRAGARLRIPGVRKKAPRHALLPPGSAQRDLAATRAVGSLRFSWPLSGRISSRFGWRWGRMHEGIDIAARKGARVRSIEAGRVVQSGRLGAYGNMVVVKHKNGFSSVYAHNRRNRVRKGERVRRGQVIAEVGATGRATGPHLHFEVRHNARALNPLRYLPQ